MTMLENLYYGNIAPHEKFIRRGSKLDKTISSLCSEEDKLTSTLTEPQKEVFGKFKQYQDELNSMTELTAFSDGFILAARLMIEVLQENK